MLTSPPTGNVNIPPIPTRLAFARLLIELDEHACALEVVRGVREEDEEDVEAAYLEGWAWFLRGQVIEERGVGVVDKGKGRAAGGLVASAEEGEEPLTKVLCWEEARESLTLCELVSLTVHDHSCVR